MVPTGERVLERLSGLADPEIQVCGHGVDLTVDAVERLTGPGRLDLDNSGRVVPEGEEVPFEGGEVHLEQGAYRATYGETVAVPMDRVGVILPRSSLMRSGATLYSALWDAGYEGRGQGLLQVMNPHGLTLERDARVGQLFFLEAEAVEEGYEGRYQGENLEG